jgi:hypothetical protein
LRAFVAKSHLNCGSNASSAAQTPGLAAFPADAACRPTFPLAGNGCGKELRIGEKVIESLGLDVAYTAEKVPILRFDAWKTD